MELPVKRLRSVSLFDLRFESLTRRDLRSLAEAASSEKLDKLKTMYAKSFGWLFYGRDLQGCKRFFFDYQPDQDSSGTSLLLNLQHEVGVFSYGILTRANTIPSRSSINYGVSMTNIIQSKLSLAFFRPWACREPKSKDGNAYTRSYRSKLTHRNWIFSANGTQRSWVAYSRGVCLRATGFAQTIHRIRS
jgi:hypothetical protein